MKLLLPIFLVLTLSSCFLVRKSQVPDVEFSRTNSFAQKVNSTLEIDPTDLVLATSSGNNYSGMFTTYYIVFKSNNKVVVFNSKTRIGHPELSSTEKIRLNKKQSKVFFNQLNQNVESNFYEINTDSLNIMTKPINDSMSYSNNISDGSTYNFWMWKGNRGSVFSSYSPRDFIYENFPGSNHRKNLLRLIKSYVTLVNDCSESININPNRF